MGVFSVNRVLYHQEALCQIKYLLKNRYPCLVIDKAGFDLRLYRMDGQSHQCVLGEFLRDLPCWVVQVGLVELVGLAVEAQLAVRHLLASKSQ